MIDNAKIIQDIFLLYELSLAVGTSLDPLENCQKFLRELTYRKRLSYAAVWLRDEEEGDLNLFFGTPEQKIALRQIPKDHFILERLKKRSFFSLATGDPGFLSLVQETNISGGAYAVYRLGDLGFLKIFSTWRQEKFPKMEMSQLESVIYKFKVSLDGCLAHKRLAEESAKRRNIQKELEKTNARFFDLFENMNDSLVIFDEQGNILEANQAAKKLALIDQLEKPNFWLLVPPDEIENTKAAFHSLVKEGEKTGFEVRIVRPDGQSRFIQVNSSGIFKNGRLVGSRHIIRDISERKRAEKDVENSQIRLSSLIRNLQAGILLENETRHILLVNQTFCTIFGIPAPPEALLGMDCSRSAEQSKVLFKDPEGFVAGIEALIKKRELTAAEELHMVDGRVLERDYIPLFSKGNYLGHLWQYRDITEKRNAAEAIRKSEEKYRGIIENMELGLLEVDNNEVVQRVYDRFCDMTGYQQEELLGKVASEILIPKDQQYIMARQQADRSKGKAGVYEIQLRKKDGSMIWVLISGAPLINREGEVIGSLGIHYDITARKKLERQLAKAKQQAEQARATEQQFLANMSHEIRTPMNAVIGMTHLLYDTPINEQQKEYLDALRFSGDTLMGIINNILDFSKIGAGELEIEEKPFNLIQLAQLLKQTFQFKLKNKPVSVVLNYDRRISNLVVADSTRINQILTNLMGNASKFTDSGTIGLSVELKEIQGDLYLVKFEVHDTGIGIPADKMETIFQSFKQADVKIARKFGGTGLGLAIVKQLVEILGGTIAVRSREGAGTTFSVELPLKNSGRRAVEKEIGKDNIGEEAKVFLSGLNVLVVEDNLMNQRLISKILDVWTCDYDIAGDGQAALQKTMETKYDLILMDIHLPGIDGCETTELMRSDAANPNQKSLIIALTAAALLEEKKRALKSGMNDFLSKPFSPLSLRKLALQKLNFQSTEKRADDKKQKDVPTPSIEIDLNYLSELSEGDPFFIRDMIETFLRETPEAILKMSRDLQEKNWDSLYRTAHSLKPNFMMLGMTTQEKDAAQLEKMVKAGAYELDILQTLVNRLDRDVQALIPLLKEKLKEI